MADAPKTTGRKTAAGKMPAPRRRAPSAVKPEKVSVPPPTMPATLTALQALEAAESATGESTPAGVETEAAPALPEPCPAPVAVIAAPVAEVLEEVTEVLEETVPEAATETVQAFAEGKTMMTDVIETTKKFSDDAKARFETAFAEINEKAKAGVEKSTKALEEISDLTKGNVEAFVESGKIAAKGVEALGQDAAEYGRKSFEKATATLKSFASIKTPAEFFQLQSELFSSSFDAFAKETAKTSEAVLKLAGDVAQPISSRVSLVTEKIKSLAA